MQVCWRNIDSAMAKYSTLESWCGSGMALKHTRQSNQDRFGALRFCHLGIFRTSRLSFSKGFGKRQNKKCFHQFTGHPTEEQSHLNNIIKDSVGYRADA
jgi:hypothetical protein